MCCVALVAKACRRRPHSRDFVANGLVFPKSGRACSIDLLCRDTQGGGGLSSEQVAGGRGGCLENSGKKVQSVFVGADRAVAVPTVGYSATRRAVGMEESPGSVGQGVR